MELLLSKILPFNKHKNKTFAETFLKLLKVSDSLTISSAYISTESLTEIKRIIEVNNGPSLNLAIGMHYFDGVTKVQHEAIKYLDNYLRKSSMGGVYINKLFRYHGKVYVFKKNQKPFASLIGSSNLSNILDYPSHRYYETDVLLEDQNILDNLHDFLIDYFEKVIPISEWFPQQYEEKNLLLEGIDGVEEITKSRISQLTSELGDLIFEIPLNVSEDHQRSNLNCYFGKGRETKKTKFIKPRHWYEAEIIVPKKITNTLYYPSGKIFDVYTDDGWKFECITSGTNMKNLRSTKDLKILGKWIKGRLENQGCLKIGEPVTESVLNAYGRNSFSLRNMKNDNTWFLDFSVK